MNRLSYLAALLAILIYGPTLSNGFIRDNDAHLAEAGWLDRVGLLQAFTDNSWHVVYEARYYRPLVLASHKLDAALWGTDPLGLHLTNVALYAALCALLALLLAELECPSGWRAALCVLFVVHPAHAECVAWLSGRSDLMACLAGGGALLAARRGRPGWVGVLLLASLLSKEVGAAFALALFVAALATKDRALGVATLGAVAVYAGLRAVALGGPAAGGALPGGTEAALMAVLALKMAGRYLAMILTGATWGAFSWDEVVARHHLLGTTDLADHLAFELDGELAWALAALAGAVAAVVWLGREARERTTLFVLLALSSLALSFTALRFSDKLNFADRYVFVPTFALALALGARIRSLLAPVTCFAVLIVCMVWLSAATERAARYRDPDSFFSGAIQDNPLSGVAWQTVSRLRQAKRPYAAWDAKLRALALHGELVPIFDVNSGAPWETYVTAVLNAARWRKPDALATLERARTRLSSNLEPRTSNLQK